MYAQSRFAMCCGKTSQLTIRQAKNLIKRNKIPETGDSGRHKVSSGTGITPPQKVISSTNATEPAATQRPISATSPSKIALLAPPSPGRLGSVGRLAAPSDVSLGGSTCVTDEAHPTLDAAWQKHISGHKVNSTKPTQCHLDDPRSLTANLDHLKEEQPASWASKQMERLAGAAGNVKPWTEVMVAIAQANPISGLVVGIFKAVVEATITIGSRIADARDFRESVNTLLRILAVCEERRIDDVVDTHIEAAYVLLLDLLSAAHKSMAAEESSLVDSLLESFEKSSRI